MVEQVVRLTVDYDGERRAIGCIHEHCGNHDRRLARRSPARWDTSGLRAATASSSGWWRPMRMPMPCEAHFMGPVVQATGAEACGSVQRRRDSKFMAIPGQRSPRWRRVRRGDLPVLDGHRPLSHARSIRGIGDWLVYCFSRSMLSYSWRAMAARISAGVLPSLVCW